MKSKFCIIVMALLASLFAAHGEEDIEKIWSDPNPLLKRIQMQIDRSDKGHEADIALAADLQTLAYAINQEIIAAESSDWATPSVERKAVIQKWADILAPETQRLVQLAFGEGFGKTKSAQQSRSLLDFAPATPTFADQVRIYITQSPWVAFAAADLLYEHRLLTDLDKQALREWHPDADRGPDLERWARGVSSFGMLDGLEVAKRTLAAEPHGETPEEIIRQYRSGLEIANLLGADAAVLLPLIESLIANPKIKASGYLNNFEYARDVISGKQPRQGRYAVNGSGPLSPWLIATSQELPETTDLSATERSAAPRKPINQKPAPSTAVEEPSSSTRWPLVAAVVVAALGLLWVLLKKRK
jgi:hypothetical protein